MHTNINPPKYAEKKVLIIEPINYGQSLKVIVDGVCVCVLRVHVYWHLKCVLGGRGQV